jgi:4-hydroxy-3-methylbut-2-enyl diphosphate reductase
MDMSEKEYLVPNDEHHPEEQQPEVETPIAAEPVAGEGGETEAAGAGAGIEFSAGTLAEAEVETGAGTPGEAGAEAEAETGAEAPAAAPVEAGAAIEAVAGEGESQPIEGMAAEIPSFKEGDILEGRVVLVQEDAAYVDVNWKSDLPVPLNELSIGKISSAREAVNEGDTIKVMVIAIEEDKIVLSRRRAEEKLVWERLKTAFHEKQPVKGKVVAAVKGGLQIDLQGITAFLPASHADLGYLPDLAVLVGQEVDLYIIEFAETRRRLVVSRKEFLAEQKEKAKKKLFGELQVGDVRTGKITRLTSFGAFVELEQGVEGLLHISEIAWERLDHPSERLQEGEEIQVKVIKVDPEAEKISLSVKQLTPHPWATVAERYKEGDIVEGKVVRLTSFGAFVRLEEGIDGLIHISQLSHERVEKAEDVVKVGDTVRVKILRVDPKERRIGLSLKETTEKPRKVVAEEKEQPPAGVYLEEDAPLSSNLGAILSEKLAENGGAGIGSFVTEEPEEVKAEPAEAKAGLEEPEAEPGEAEAGLEAAEVELEKAEAVPDEAKAELEEAKVELDEAKVELEEAETGLKEAEAEPEGGILDQAAIDEIIKKVAGEGAAEEGKEETEEPKEE